LKFFLFLFSFFFLYSLEINISYYKGDTKSEILTLYNNEPFLCKKKFDKVICEFDKLPSTPVFKTSSVFFKIIPQFKGSKFFLVIYVKKFFILKSFQEHLYKNAVITPFLFKKAKKWVIIASNKKIIIPSSEGLKFYFHHSPMPFVGVIDENGNPVEKEKESEDIIKYFEILKAYKEHKDVSLDIEHFIKNYPNSIFLPDILFLKLQILDKNNESEEVIKLGKEWIKKFAYDENLRKVLLTIAKNYAKMGFLTDANYLYQRIINEYPNTKEAYLAMIYLGDELYIMGDEKKSFEFYKKALYSTNDIEIASFAAARLAERYMNRGEIDKAIEYYMKIYRANKEYLLRDKYRAYELIKNLASHKVYDLAVKIGEDLIKRLKKLDDLYEVLEYNLAKWYYEKRNYDKALYWINKYLNDFPYGEYSDEISALRDRVIFQIDDKNLTKQLEVIDEILKKYTGEIVDKALYKKVLLLYKLKKFDEILKLEDKIKKIPDNIFRDKEKFLNKVYKEYAVSLLNKNECFKVVELIKSKKIVLDKKYDDKVYECAIRVKEYNLVSIVCNKYLTSPDDKVFVKWMKRKIEALEGLENYKDLVLAVDDLCNVMKKGCYEYRLKKFFALWKLKRYKEALTVAEKLDKKEDIRNVDAFIKIVNYALENNNSLLASTYAKKIIKLQNKFKTYPYSPFVEFTYVKFSKNKKESIKILKNLLNRVKGEDKARAYFILANLTEDKKYIDKCLKVKNSKIWKNLCKDAKDLF
jgi:tetratricopeptide (TPR) repeat protein